MVEFIQLAAAYYEKRKGLDGSGWWAAVIKDWGSGSAKWVDATLMVAGGLKS